MSIFCEEHARDPLHGLPARLAVRHRARIPGEIMNMFRVLSTNSPLSRSLGCFNKHTPYQETSSITMSDHNSPTYGSPVQMGEWSPSAIAVVVSNRSLWEDIGNNLELLVIAGEASSLDPPPKISSLKKLARLAIRRAIWQNGSPYFLRKAVSSLNLPNTLKSYVANKI